LVIKFNALESERFGARIAHVTDPHVALDQVNIAAREDAIDMLTLRIDSSAIARVQDLESDGYRLMDTLVYYERALDDLPPLGPAPDTELIRLAVPDDAAAVAHVARLGFKGYSGHYHTDPRLSSEAADAAYTDWAEKSIIGCDDTAPVLVAETEGVITGFMTARFTSDTMGEAVLSAIHPQSQGGGMYGRLFAAVMKTVKELGGTRLSTSTQLNNLAVQRAWVGKGLRMSNSLYTFHKWF